MPDAAPKRRFPADLSFGSGAQRSTRSGATVAGTRNGIGAASAPAERASGVGLDSSAVRLAMVQRLRAQPEMSEAVLQAMALVPRHLFVDSALANQAYADTSLPIGWGQTISKPSVVARMLSLLPLGPSGRMGKVLEIGTGCGYQAAVLAHLARHVVSVERVEGLYQVARDHLARAGVTNVQSIYGDGMRGYGPSAPFQAIVAAAGGEDIPPAWLDQLAVGGRLVAPCANPQGGQRLVVVDRHAQGYERRELEAVLFVPLKSGLSAS